MRARGAWMAVGVAGLTVAACGGGGGAREAADIPVLAEALSPPGTELGNGFVVAEGSQLIAAPIPLGTTLVYRDEPVVDDGWTAWLWVSGDPEEVLDAYLAQAAEQGLEEADLATGDPFAMEGEPVPPTSYARCGTEGDGAYVCFTKAAEPTGERCLVLSLRRTGSRSHLQVDLILNGRYGDGFGPCDGPAGTAVDPSRPPPPTPEREPDLPGPGERLGDRWPALAAIEVQQGSRVVAEPLPGGRAALAIDGDPEEVLASYLDAFRALVPPDPYEFADDHEVDGLQLHQRGVAEPAGGPTFVAEMVTTDDGEAWLFLDAKSG